MKFILVLICLTAATSCGVLPKGMYDHSPTRHIQVGLGPEDMVLDTLSSSNPKLIVACDSRRAKLKSGWIYQVNLTTGDTAQIQRVNEPENLVFHPHGIDLVQLENGNLRILVVSHDDDNKQQSILQYAWDGERLHFEKNWQDPLLLSPNDVCGDAFGRIYTGNEFKKRGAKWAPILGLNNGNVLCLENGNNRVVANGFCYTNGLATNDKQFFVAATRNKHLYVFDKLKDGHLTNRRKLCRLKGGDNLFLYGKDLYVACHLRNLAFIAHVLNSEKKSPTVIYRVDTESGKKTCIYTNKNGKINAASTAIVYNGKLYICQVFEPFLLEVALQ
jgi:hypothetical protein